MKNTEIAFYSFKQYLSIDIYMDIYCCTSEVMEIHLKYFIFFPCFWKKSFEITWKTKAFLTISSNVSYVWYICYVPRHWKRMTMIMMTENLATKIAINNLQILLCRHYEVRKVSQKYGQRPCNAEMKIHFFQFQSERGSLCAYTLRPWKSPFLVKWNLPVY